MKKLLVTGLLALAMAGCGDNQVADNTDVEKPVVQEPVKVEMKYTDVTPQQIREHIKNLDTEVKKIANFKFDDPARNAEQSRKMLGLRDTPMPFGEGMFDEPYGYCGSAEIFAVQYWYSMLGGDKNKTAKDELKIYQDYKKACLEAVTKVENGEYQP